MEEANKGGRPTKLNDELKEEILKVIRSGNYIETACAYAGIEKKTLYNWMKRGRSELERLDKNPRAKMKKAEAIYVDFLHSIQKALAHAEIRDVAIIGKAAEESWQASAWRLERKFPDRWGRKDKVTQEINHSGEINQSESKTVTEKIDMYEEMYMRVAKEKVDAMKNQQKIDDET